jgi:hypothetical protein
MKRFMRAVPRDMRAILEGHSTLNGEGKLARLTASMPWRQPFLPKSLLIAINFTMAMNGPLTKSILTPGNDGF